MNEYSGDISGSRNNSWKCSQYSSQRFQHALPMSTLGSKKMLTPEHKETGMTLAVDLITTADQDITSVILYTLNIWLR
jgi:hypothetical protein